MAPVILRLSPEGSDVVLRLPSEGVAKLALLRGAYRRAAKALREQLGYPGAALALEKLAASLQTASSPEDEDDCDKTVVDLIAFA